MMSNKLMSGRFGKVISEILQVEWDDDSDISGDGGMSILYPGYFGDWLRVAEYSLLEQLVRLLSDRTESGTVEVSSRGRGTKKGSDESTLAGVE